MTLIIFALFLLSPAITIISSQGYMGLGRVGKCDNIEPFNDEPSLIMKENTIGGDYDTRRMSFTCKSGHYLVGSPILKCLNGVWEHSIRPRCLATCDLPPPIHNGYFSIDTWKQSTNYPNGTIAHYSCKDGYQMSPSESRRLSCSDGIWTGSIGICGLVKCDSIEQDLPNGFIIHDSGKHRAHFSCRSGYALVGPSKFECVDGSWWPQNMPTCVRLEPIVEDTSAVPEEQNVPRIDDDSDLSSSTVHIGRACPPPPQIRGTSVESVRGMVTANTAMAGSEIELRCDEGLRDDENPCEPTILHCINGAWRGRHPSCVPFSNCMPLPGIPHGALFGLATDGRYRVGARVAYTCQPGYRLHGQPVFSCEINGCWSPALLPECLPDDQPFYLSGLRNWEEYALSPGAALLASLATALAVMALLFAVCMAVVCRRRRRSSGRHTGTSGARAQRLHWPDQSPEQPPQLPPSLLPPDPDRVALIAFADGLQVGQSVLPSYEEATRERGASAGVLYGALHRTGRGPHWTALASTGGGGRRVRRDRHQQQQQDGDTVSHHSLHGGLCTRQSSSTSHSASLRSYAVGGAGESMGSTDTVAAGSEGSTTVTLDTVSSHTSSLASGGPGSACSSQTASCRAICGSLASFDTSSVLNTEGVPLLEESELEGAAEARADEDNPAVTTPAGCAETKMRGSSPDRA